MYLKSLEIAGFKSFAKKSSLEFGAPITAIVGPNGSGKSNVAESFRFALGEQSIKSMRGKKGEDMIFNGSNKVGKLNRAGVRVVFDNTKRIMDIDFDEVTIERVVNRDSSNEYYINGSQVRLRDVIELLASSHIGATGHHIISQGEADKVLNANPRERRAMIEDALGLKVYQYKRQESERKLEKTAENIKQVESLRRELAPHLKFLRKQVEKVEKAREMKIELTRLYREYFKREDAYLRAEEARVASQKKAPTAELHELEKELGAARKTLESANATADGSGHGGKHGGASADLLALEEKLKAERIQRDNLSRDLGRIEGEVASIERSVKRVEQSAQIEEQKTVYLRDVQDLARTIDEFIAGGEKTDDIVETRSMFKKIRDSVSGFIAKHRTSNDAQEKQKQEYQSEIAELRTQKAEIEGQISAVQASEKALGDQYNALKSEIEKKKEGGLEAEKAILKIMTRQNEINAALSSLRVLEEKLRIETEDFKRELGEAGILAGREAVDFASAEVAGGMTDGANGTSSEDRAHQSDRRRAIEKIKIRLEEFGGGTSEEIMKEFKEAEERDAYLAREVADLEKSAESLQALIVELKEKLDIEFKEGIRKINVQFQEFFALMFGGGTAGLQVVKEEKRRKKSELDALGEMRELVGGDGDGDGDEMAADSGRGDTGNGSDESDTEKEQPEGIEIQVSLPHKKIKGLVMLSGGERALTSIALLFAMSQVNPPPFIILDETDAALDEANSRKYGDMIENLSHYSQLILITHNRETMSRAGIIYGVTMGSDGISKLLSIQFDEAVQVAK